VTADVELDEFIGVVRQLQPIGGHAGPQDTRRSGGEWTDARYSTVTVFARFRGWSTFSPRARAMW
jgi:hypothetical protein